MTSKTCAYSGDSTELVYLRARQYAPGIGRFLTRDTWSGNYNKPLSLNRWMYVEGNPVNYTDPSGYWPLGNNLEVYPGGFYGLGKLRIEGGSCLHAKLCYMSKYTWADIFVSPARGTGNDVQYKVYQFPNNINAETLLQDMPKFLNRIERIDKTISTVECTSPWKMPDVRMPDVRLSDPYLNTNWKFAYSIHGYTDTFKNGQSALTAFASTNSPDQIHNDTGVTGVPLFDPKTGTTYPYTYESTGDAGNVAQGLALIFNVWGAVRTLVTREYWVSVEENTLKPGLLRAQIITNRQDGSHYKFWFGADGWHEDPFYDELLGK